MSSEFVLPPLTQTSHEYIVWLNFPLPTRLASGLFPCQEKLVAPLIAQLSDKVTKEWKEALLRTTSVIRLHKEVNNFLQQIGLCPNTNYAK